VHLSQFGGDVKEDHGGDVDEARYDHSHRPHLEPRRVVGVHAHGERAGASARRRAPRIARSSAHGARIRNQTYEDQKRWRNTNSGAKNEMHDIIESINM